MSTYLRDGSPFYQAAVTLPGGKKVLRKSTGSKNKEDADRFERAWRVKLGLGEAVFENSQSITFKELWEKCIADWKQKWPRSWKRFHATHRDRLVDFFGDMPIKTIKTVHIIDWRNKLIDTTSNSTINHAMAVLLAALNLAVSWELLAKVPKNPGKLTQSKGRIRFLNYEEQQRLLTVAATIRPLLHDLALVALRTGMRRGELLRLRVCDVDFQRKTLNLVLLNKNNKFRYLPIPPSIENLLHKLCAKKKSGDPIFSKTGLTNIWKNWQEIIDLAEIEDFRFHDLRHTFASDMLAAGVALPSLKELMGHSTFEMTLRYAHLAPDFKRAEIMKLEDHLKKECEVFTSQNA